VKEKNSSGRDRTSKMHTSIPIACRPIIDSPRLLNNEAYCLIKKRQYDEAVGLLTKALSLIKKTTEEADMEPKQLVSADGSSNVPCDNPSSTSPSVPESSRNQSCPHDTFHRSFHMQDQLEASPHHSPYIYKEPMYITHISMFSGDNSTITTMFFTAIIFNLSLCYHLKGIENEDDILSRKNLEKSKRLYELTFQMHAQLTETNFLLTTALLNNLALVHKALNNQYEADRCDQRLLRALLLIVDRGGVLTEDNKKVLDCFMGNVMHLVMKNSSVASAA
jgi:tetratricopeptide (TPR) repeat protein